MTSIRYATPKDILLLLELELECWESHLRASRDELLRRIEAYPQGQLVIEIDGKILGVLYTQRISSIDALTSGSFATQFSLHRPDGSFVQLLAIAVRSHGNHNLAATLRDYALERARSDSSIQGVVAMTRCSRFRNYLDSLVASRASEACNIENESFIKDAYSDYLHSSKDPTIFFHQSGGAKIVEIMSNYRVEDSANCGYAVLIHYDIRNADASVKVSDSYLLESRNANSVEGDLSTLICMEIQKITKRFEGELAPSKTSPFMALLDSFQLLTLHNWLEEHLGIKLESAFLFNHFTPLLVEERLVRGFKRDAFKPSTKVLSSRIKDNRSNDVAIVGVAMKFPRKVVSLDALWEMMISKSSTFAKVPFERFDINSLEFEGHTRTKCSPPVCTYLGAHRVCRIEPASHVATIVVDQTVSYITAVGVDRSKYPIDACIQLCSL